MHVPEHLLPIYRDLRERFRHFDSLGNNFSNVGEYEEANKAWAVAGRYMEIMQKLREAESK